MGQGLRTLRNGRLDCYLVEQWFSKCDSTGVTWELVRNALLSQASSLGGSEGGPTVCFNKPSRVF